MPEISDEERSRRCVIGLCVAHTILVLLAVLPFTAGFTDYTWPRWQSIFIEALAISQVGLSSAMLVIGGAALSLRIFAFAAVAPFWLFVLTGLQLDNEFWLAVFAFQMAGIGCALSLARILGVRLIHAHHADEERLPTAKYRYSLRQLLLWMTAASVLLFVGTLNWQAWGFQQSIDLGVLPRAKILGLSLFPITLVALWATLGTKRRIMPFFLLLLVAAVASLAVARTDRLFRTAWWSSST